MLRILTLIALLLSSLNASDITGIWEIDKEAQQKYLKEIGEEQQKSVANFSLEINKHSVKIDKQKYPLSTFKTNGSQTHLFFLDKEPVFITRRGDNKVRIMNFKNKILVCSKKSDIKLEDESIEKLKGRWNFKLSSLLKQMDPETLRIAAPGLSKVKNLNFAEIEFRKNTIICYLCDFPLPITTFTDKFEIKKTGDNEFTINSKSQFGGNTLKLTLSKNNILSVEFVEDNKVFELVKSDYKTTKVKFTEKFLNKELKRLLNTVYEFDTKGDQLLADVKISIIPYIFSLQKDKKKLIEYTLKHVGQIEDEEEKRFFIESALGYLYFIAPFEEIENFYIKHFNGKFDNEGLCLTLLAEKALDSKKKEKFEFYLKKAEKHEVFLLQEVKQAPPEDKEFLQSDYKYYRSVLLFLKNKAGIKVDLSKEDTVVQYSTKLSYANEYRLTGDLKKYEQLINDCIQSLHEEKVTALIPYLDLSYSISASTKKRKDFILPNSLALKFINSEDYDNWDRCILFMNLADYHYSHGDLDHAYLNFYRYIMLGAEGGESYCRILGSINNSDLVYMTHYLMKKLAPEKALYFLQEYASFLHEKIDLLPKQKK